jgi:hypothetical protein
LRAYDATENDGGVTVSVQIRQIHAAIRSARAGDDIIFAKPPRETAGSGRRARV